MAMTIALLALFTMNFAAIWFLTNCVVKKRKRTFREYKVRLSITASLATILLLIEIKGYAVPLAAVKYIVA